MGECLCIYSKVPSNWLLSHTKVAQPLEISKIVVYFSNRPCSLLHFFVLKLVCSIINIVSIPKEHSLFSKKLTEENIKQLDFLNIFNSVICIFIDILQ